MKAHKCSLSQKWVDRIFVLLEEIYQDKWRSHIGHPENVELYKTAWANGLASLTSGEIRQALDTCRFYKNKTVPTVVEFFYYAKHEYRPEREGSLLRKRLSDKLAKQSIDQMKTTLTGRYTHERG